MSVSSLRSPVSCEFQGTVADGRAAPRASARRGMVGVIGFEPPTPCYPSRRASGLRHAPVKCCEYPAPPEGRSRLGEEPGAGLGDGPGAMTDAILLLRRQ